MKKINQKLEKFGAWFFRIKTPVVTVPDCVWELNRYKPW